MEKFGKSHQFLGAWSLVSGDAKPLPVLPARKCRFNAFNLHNQEGVEVVLSHPWCMRIEEVQNIVEHAMRDPFQRTSVVLAGFLDSDEVRGNLAAP